MYASEIEIFAFSIDSFDSELGLLHVGLRNQNVWAIERKSIHQQKAGN
jgi:hypothetical protein